MRDEGRRLVEAGALGRREGVVAAGIQIEFDVGAVREGALDLLARLRRREPVELGEVKHHRALDVGGLAEVGLYADAIIGDRAIDIGAGRREISELAAKAEAERPDLANA